MALPLVDTSHPTSSYPNGPPTSTSVVSCYCVASMSAPGLSRLCPHCSRIRCRNAPQRRRFKAMTSRRQCGDEDGVGSRVRGAVAGIYENRSLRINTPSTWAGWTQCTSASTVPTKPMTGTVGNQHNLDNLSPQRYQGLKWAAHDPKLASTLSSQWGPPKVSKAGRRMMSRSSPSCTSRLAS